MDGANQRGCFLEQSLSENKGSEMGSWVAPLSQNASKTELQQAVGSRQGTTWTEESCSEERQGLMLIERHKGNRILK